MSTPNSTIAKLSTNTSLISTFLIANAFVWYVSAFSYIQYVAADLTGYSSLLLVGASFACLVLTAFIASTITRPFSNRVSFLKKWSLAGILLSFPLIAVESIDFPLILLLACIVGAYFGLGMPACMAYFAKETQSQNRAKLSGLIILLIGICYPLISLIGSSAIIVALTLLVWRSLSLIAILPIKPEATQPQTQTKTKVTYKSILTNRSFLFYVIPWLMFSLINDLTMELNTLYFGSANLPAPIGSNFMLIENVLAGASAIICGIWADKKGRKRLALVAFALLGVGYASLGFFSGQYAAALFYICVDGFAWGVFSMLFISTVWGDIAHEHAAEKYYFLGVLPYLFSNLTRISLGPYVTGYIGNESMIFSFASFFLFVAILPLAYAPETLSEKIIKKVELDSYIERALQEVNKQKV